MATTQYVISSVSKQTSTNGFEYLRVEYTQKIQVNAQQANQANYTALAKLGAAMAKPLVEVYSSRKFNNGQPDLQAAHAWVEQMYPIFDELGKAQQVFEVEHVMVDVAPYYRINNGNVDTSQVHNTLDVDLVLNPLTGQPFTTNAAQTKANSRLRNGSTMYITVDEYNKQQAITPQQQAGNSDALGGLANGMQNGATYANPF